MERTEPTSSKPASSDTSSSTATEVEDVSIAEQPRLSSVTEKRAGRVIAGLACTTVVVTAGLARYLGAQPPGLWVFIAVLVVLVAVASVGAYRAAQPWNLVEMVVAAVVAVGCGGLLWLLALGWDTLTGPLVFFPPLSAALNGLWVLPGVVGAWVIRRPGASVFTETVAAVVEALWGNTWGFTTMYYGVFQGLGAEVPLAVTGYRYYTKKAAFVSGAGAGVAVGALSTLLYYPDYSISYQLIYLVLSVISGAVIAGLGGYGITRSLAATGVLDGLGSGRQVRV